jgi:hypothetical protein
MIADRVTSPRIIERIAKGWNGPPQVIGQQQIVQGLQDHSCTIFSTELSVLLGASDQMLDFLCEGWDRNEYDYDTKTSGSAFIKDMCTSLIGGTVPDFIQLIDKNRNMPVKGGFTSRCLFIYEDKPARYMLHPPPLENDARSAKKLDELKNDLAHISSLPGGEFTYDTASCLIFDDFLTRLRVSVDEDSEAVTNFKARARVHVLKLGMIISLSRHDTLIIEPIDMALAVSLVEEAIRTLEYVFRGSGDSDMAVATARIQNYIEKAGMATRRDMLSRLHRHMNAETLDKIIYVLSEIGYWRPELIGSVCYFKPIITPNGTQPKGGKRP